MHKLKVFTSSVLLVTTPSMLVYPTETLTRSYVQLHKVSHEEKIQEKDDAFSYDDILRLLNDIEADELENRCSVEELEKITHFITFLAKEGALSDHSEESLSLDSDIEDLLHGDDNLYEDAISFATLEKYQYTIVPAVLHGNREIVLCKSWVKKKWNHIKKFSKKHKKALIIGAAIVVAASVVAVAVAASVATAAGVAVATDAADSSYKQGKEDNKENSSSAPHEMPDGISVIHEAPILKSAIDNQISSFKENIVQNQFFNSTDSVEQQSLSWEENGRALGSLLAHGSYNSLQNQLPGHPGLAQEVRDLHSKYTFSIPIESSDIGHSEIDRKFSTDYTYLYANPSQEVDFTTLSYQVRGERALSLGHYNQAVQDLGKVIETNPSNPNLYLERGIAHFNLAQYDRSLEDYKQFTSQTQKPVPLSVSEFSLGFAKGLPKGVYESGEGLFLFMTEFVKHPIQTSTQVVDSVSKLVDLFRKDEWGIIAETLSPEAHQLVTQWDTMSSEKRGELAGYAVGKHGADILIPGAVAKVASKSLKSAQELSAICKNLQRAQEALVLETAAEIGSSMKIAEVVNSGRKIKFLGEELGFTPKEMGQLKKLGKLEQAIDSACDGWLAKSPNEAYIVAKNGGRHASIITEFNGKSVKEIQKSIRSYEKLIAKHKDKIANPSEYCPDWETFHPNRQKALIDKIWTIEIQCYTEQIDILKTILNQKN